MEIEEECLKIMALYQPVVVDLHFIATVIKINNNLERVGDIAVNIAERVLTVAKRPPDLLTTLPLTLTKWRQGWKS